MSPLLQVTTKCCLCDLVFKCLIYEWNPVNYDGDLKVEEIPSHYCIDTYENRGAVNEFCVNF